jgi:hypothetical protein
MAGELAVSGATVEEAAVSGSRRSGSCCGWRLVSFGSLCVAPLGGVALSGVALGGVALGGVALGGVALGGMIRNIYMR